MTNAPVAAVAALLVLILLNIAIKNPPQGTSNASENKNTEQSLEDPTMTRLAISGTAYHPILFANLEEETCVSVSCQALSEKSLESVLNKALIIHNAMVSLKDLKEFYTAYEIAWTEYQMADKAFKKMNSGNNQFFKKILNSDTIWSALTEEFDQRRKAKIKSISFSAVGSMEKIPENINGNEKNLFFDFILGKEIIEEFYKTHGSDMPLMVDEAYYEKKMAEAKKFNDAATAAIKARTDTYQACKEEEEEKQKKEITKEIDSCTRKANIAGNIKFASIMSNTCRTAITSIEQPRPPVTDIAKYTKFVRKGNVLYPEIPVDWRAMAKNEDWSSTGSCRAGKWHGDLYYPWTDRAESKVLINNTSEYDLAVTENPAYMGFKENSAAVQKFTNRLEDYQHRKDDLENATLKKEAMTKVIIHSYNQIMPLLIELLSDKNGTFPSVITSAADKNKIKNFSNRIDNILSRLQELEENYLSCAQELLDNTDQETQSDMDVYNALNTELKKQEDIDTYNNEPENANKKRLDTAYQVTLTRTNSTHANYLIQAQAVIEKFLKETENADENFRARYAYPAIINIGREKNIVYNPEVPINKSSNSADTEPQPNPTKQREKIANCLCYADMENFKSGDQYLYFTINPLQKIANEAYHGALRWEDLITE